MFEHALYALDLERRWQEETKAKNAAEYLSGFTYSISKPNTYTASAKSPELTETWPKVTEIIRNGSWNCVYAKSEEEFERILSDMCRQAEEAGYADCVLWCEKEAARRRKLEE